MIAARMTQPATLHQASNGVKDAAGDVVATFTDAPDPIYLDLQQQSGSEIRDGRIVSVTTWLAFVRPDATLTSRDELTVNGGRFSIEGDPWLVRHPRTGLASHWLVRLRKVS